MGSLLSWPASQASSLADRAQTEVIKRQFAVQNMMRETQLATRIGLSRDLLAWLTYANGITVLGGAALRLRTGKWTGFVPLVPLHVGWLYQYDLAYGNKLLRVRQHAEDVLTNHSELLVRPVHPAEAQILPFIDPASRTPAPPVAPWSIIFGQPAFKESGGPVPGNTSLPAIPLFEPAVGDAAPAPPPPPQAPDASGPAT